MCIDHKTYRFAVAPSIFISAAGLAYAHFVAFRISEGAETFQRFLGASQIILTSIKGNISKFFDKLIRMKSRSTMTASWTAVEKELNREIDISSIAVAL